MKQTANYQLNQWDADDRILRTDFNADNAKIDAALKGSADRMLGMICVWSGTADAIPAGWALCDGQNGTPDLQGRFVLGADPGHAAGSTGGEAAHALTERELPAHRHTVSIQVRGSESGAGDTVGYGTPHNFVETSKVTESAGGSQPHNNMPPYYALCFVMYLGETA